jgi:pimeloyl-ACP methyl ester carboxylesterase
MDTVFSADGTRIAFERTGDGPPLILVGGALQQRADPMMAALAGLLGEDLTVVRYDRRGRGDSGDTAPYAPARESEDLEAVAGALGGSVVAFGMSSGAVLALDTAARGGAIARLAVYEPPAIVDDSRDPVPAGFPGRLRDLVAQGRRDDAVSEFMTIPAGAPVELVAAMRQAPFWPAMTGLAHTLSYDAEIMSSLQAGAPIAVARWASVRAPVLVLDGSASPGWVHAAAAAVAIALPVAERSILAGQTHAVDPAVLAPALRRWFAGG